jgi:hypothetical protein
MSTKDNGGPAFPQPLVVGRDGEILGPDDFGFAGMTMRDYFMAHAPAEPQPWFVPEMPPRPKPRWVSDDGLREYATISEAEKHEGECFSNASRDECEAWDKERRKAGYVQWPAAWADAMLAERAK